MTKGHRLAIKIDDDDLAWLASQEDDLGIDKVSIISMMIRRHRKAGLSAIQSAPIVEHEVVTRAIDPREYVDLVPYGDQQEPVEDVEETIEDLVASRLSEAKPVPSPILNEFGIPQGTVRPLRHNRKPSGKDWMRG